ncbi:MAG: trigger factor [Chlorobiota bacterium]
MEHEVLHIADCERELHLRLSAAEVASTLEEAYRKAQQTLVIEGFRKGKAPIELIRQRYGATIETEALERLGQRLFREIAQEQRWVLLGEPQLTNLNRSPEGVQFTFRYYTLPELTIDLSDIKLRMPAVSVSEEEVEAQLERLRLRYGTTEEKVEQVTDYYHEVTLHFQPVELESGMPLVGEPAEELTLALYDEDVLPELRQQLLNIRQGESFLHTLPSADTGQAPRTYRITVQAIRRRQPAELTPEFVQRLSQGRLQDVDALRAYLREELQHQQESYARSLLRNQLELEVARRYRFVPPKPLVHSIARELIESLQRGELSIPAEYLREGESGIYRFLAELADYHARLSILELLLLRQYQVQLTPEELQALARSLNLSEEVLQQRLREDTDLLHSLRRRKLWQLLLQSVHVEVTPSTDHGEPPVHS